MRGVRTGFRSEVRLCKIDVGTLDLQRLVCMSVDVIPIHLFMVEQARRRDLHLEQRLSGSITSGPLHCCLSV